MLYHFLILAGHVVKIVPRRERVCIYPILLVQWFGRQPIYWHVFLKIFQAHHQTVDFVFLFLNFNMYASAPLGTSSYAPGGGYIYCREIHFCIWWYMYLHRGVKTAVLNTSVVNKRLKIIQITIPQRKFQEIFYNNSKNWCLNSGKWPLDYRLQGTIILRQGDMSSCNS